MKKYKLVKEYPGSPKLDTILTKDDQYRLQDGRWVYQVGENEEYWQEVIGKDYEILSVRNKIAKHYIYYNGIDPNFSLYISRLDSTHKFLEIHSVKRLSDGEIFTIGDKISLVARNDADILNSIKIEKDIILFNDYTNGIEYWKKAKQKLFTTEDGVDIFEGDKYFYKTFLWDLASALTTDLNKHYLYNTTFSTKEAVQEYIIQNKPCLSFKEVVDYLVNNGYLYGSKTKVTKGLMQFSYLKTKIKKKLE